MTLKDASFYIHSLRPQLPGGKTHRFLLRPRPKLPPTLSRIEVGVHQSYEVFLSPQPTLHLSSDLLKEGETLLLDLAAALFLPFQGQPDAWTLAPGPAICFPHEQPFTHFLSCLHRSSDRPQSPLLWISGEQAALPSFHHRLSIARIRTALPRIPGLHPPWPDETRLVLPFEGGITLLSKRPHSSWSMLGLYVQ